MLDSKDTAKKAFQGIILGFLVFVLLFSSLAVTPPVNAEQAPLFSITLLAPTTNPVRRQTSALLANALQTVGVNARVTYVTFSDLINRLFPEVANIGKTYDQGGFDIGFIGWGYTSPVPDIKSQYFGSKDAFPPTGNNYALYNSSQANALLNQIYTTLDSAQQLKLFQQLSVVLNTDKPYIPYYVTSDVVARRPEIKDYGDAGVFSTMATPFNDLQYFSGVTSYTFDEAGDWTSLAPWANSDSNSFYSLFVYGVTQGGLQLIDPRTQTFFMNEAKSIKASADGRTWNITIKPGIMFHDGVELTADDYLFTEMALMTPSVASVTLSDKLSRFGNRVAFTWRNGTTTTVDNSNNTLTAPTTTFTASPTDRYTYSFSIGSSVPVYAFLNSTECAIAPLPKHILEKFPMADWNQLGFATGLKGAQTYTWDTTRYGGSGSYTAYGPIGTGPYVYKGFDPVARVATLEKFDGFFDKARLEGLGYFTVETYRVVVVVEKDAAIANYRNGEADMLDVNYQLAADQDTLRSLGANVFIKPEIGWQEFGFNMMHPIVGTGTGTPKGTAEAARHVRQAISYLVPRDLIVSQLLSGAGTPGTTILGTFGSGFQDPSVKPDPYDPTLAKAELASAGYQTGVSPITPTPPPPEVAADFIFGQAVPVDGNFKNPVTGDPYVNFVVKIQESPDQVKWVETGHAPITDSSGNYHAMVVPSYQTTYFRANFTGAVVSSDVAGTWPINAGDYYDELVTAGKVQAVLPPLVGPAQQYTTKTLKDILTGALEPYATAASVTQLQTTVATKTDVSSLTDQITALNANVSSLTTYLYASLAVAVIAIIIAIVAMVRKH